MKTKLGASLVAALMMMGLFGAASANAVPDPNGPAYKGLCTAYFNGSDTGLANKRGAPPFVALAAAAAAVDQTVAVFCGATEDENGEVTDPGTVIGGNPDFEDPGEANNNRDGNRTEG